MNKNFVQVNDDISIGLYPAMGAAESYVVINNAATDQTVDILLSELSPTLFALQHLLQQYNTELVERVRSGLTN